MSGCVATCLFLMALAEPGSAKPPVRITVFDEVLHTIDPRLFGQFMERDGPDEPGPESAVLPDGRFRGDVDALLREPPPPVTRFPGGVGVEFTRPWTDLIDRPDTGVPRPAGCRFGLHEFLDWCERVGSEPLLVVRLGQPDRESEEAASAAAMVAYCNGRADDPALPEPSRAFAALRARNGRAEPWNVRLWQIGNEPFLSYIPALHRRGLDAPQIAERYAEAVRGHIRAMRRVDASIRVLVDVQMEDGLGAEAPPVPAIAALRAALPGEIDYLSCHVYRPWAVKEVLRDGRAARLAQFGVDDLFRAFAAVPWIDPETGASVFRPHAIEGMRASGIDLAVTEWNLNFWWDRPDGDVWPRSKLAEGVGAASMLHAFMREGGRIRVAAQSMLVGSTWGIAGLYVPPDGGPAEQRPTLRVTRLYARHHGARMLRVEAASDGYEQPFDVGGIRAAGRVANVDVLATAQDEPGGALFLHVVHRDPSADRRLDVTLPEGFDGAEVIAHAIAAEPAEGRARLQVWRESSDPAGRVMPGGRVRLTLPAAAVVVYEVRRDRS